MFNDDDSSLEALLRNAKLRKPSPFLDARIQASLTRRPYYRWVIAAGLLIAASIGVRLALPPSFPVAQVIAPNDHPIQLERATSTLYDDGVIASTGDGAYQQFRRRTVHEIWYINPTAHSQLRVTIPTEQVVIQKVESF